jgi:hypothetical protein
MNLRVFSGLPASYIVVDSDYEEPWAPFRAQTPRSITRLNDA